MSKPVRTTPTADAKAEVLDQWWRENREKAPELFSEELAMALRTIGAMPGGGRSHPHPEAPVRRVLMRATRTHDYYVERDVHVLVVAVWGAIRGVGPDLTDLG